MTQLEKRQVNRVIRNLRAVEFRVFDLVSELLYVSAAEGEVYNWESVDHQLVNIRSLLNYSLSLVNNTRLEMGEVVEDRR